MNKYLTSEPSVLDVHQAEQSITQKLITSGKLQAQEQVLIKFKETIMQKKGL